MKNIFKFISIILTCGMVACGEQAPEYGDKPDTTIASLGIPPNNEIWFTTSNDKDLIVLDESAFNSAITDIEYSESGINVIRFAESLTTIGVGAFDNCRNLKNISLPESVTAIGDRAFFECTNLECLTLGPKIRNCGSQAFELCVELYSLHISSVGDWSQIEFANPTANPLYYCNYFIVNGNKLNNIVLPSWISHIGDYAFYNYALMTSITIPAKVKSVGKDAFEGCERLSQVNIESVAAWCNVDFATATSNPISTAGALFINGVPANAISLKGVETIAPKVFMGCNNIISIVADSSLRTIGEEAFRGCIGLLSVELHEGIAEIAGKAFMGCSALNSVKCYAVVPPQLGDEYTFRYNAEKRKFYVPSESLNTYREDSDWSQYAGDIEAIN